jgi:hypothetical protein
MKKTIFALALFMTALARGENMANSLDVLNTDQIYTDTYQYSLPKNVLESFLSGKAFDHHQPYTEEESARLEADIRTIFQTVLSFHPVKENLAVITAGAPGAGKTIKLQQDLKEKSDGDKNYAYICPDDVCLKQQELTYKADIDHSDNSKETRQALYNKWRPGSNAATHLILANLIREKYAFYFGTTSTGPATCKFFDFLKKQGYQIRLLHITAPDDVRWGSIQERDKTFIQTTEEDVREKGLLLPQRINDTVLAYADEIEFYYRDAVNEDAKLAATWIRKEPEAELKIQDESLYGKIKEIHNAAIEKLNRPDLQWELTVEKSRTQRED